MGDWIRHRGSKKQPDCLAGKKFQVRTRNGCIVDINLGGSDGWWEHEKEPYDIMAYRIIEDDQALPHESHAHTFGIDGDTTTPPDGLPENRIDVIGQNGNTGEHYAIDTSPERVEIEQENVHEPDIDEPIGKRVADAMFTEMMKRHPSEHLEHDLQSAAERIKWESVFGLRDIVDAARTVGVQIKFESIAPTTAPAFLQSAINTLTQRGKDYDKPEGERSASAVAVAFNAITGRNLTEAEVWLVLQLVKDVRQWQNPDRYHADSALDCVAYAALKAEALASGSKQ